MIFPSTSTVVLDACVLYPAPVRDFMLSMADADFFKPKWSDQIQDEWMRNLLVKRKDLSRKQLNQVVKAMNKAFPDADVKEYHDLIDSLHLPDEDDRHVLACAIVGSADLIITFNLKDFPTQETFKYSIEVQSPDDFGTALIDFDEIRSVKVFEKIVNRLKKPPMTALQVLEVLSKCGMPLTANRLKGLVI